MSTAARRKRQEERVKLFATAFSNLGVASVVTGVIAPVLSARAHLLASAVVLVVGVSLHLVGQFVLHFVATSPEAEP